MTNEEINEKIEQVKKEQKQAEDAFLMCQGALNVLNSMLTVEEDAESKD